jgi:hypothetical protein
LASRPILHWRAAALYRLSGREYWRPDSLSLSAARILRDFIYNIPVANGNYQLTLRFAEIQYASAGARVFNVTVNGAAVLTNFDIVAQAGSWTAIDKQFPVTVTHGAVQINVHGVTGVGLLNAIQIAPATGGDPSPACSCPGTV